jgi:hypothetical protein
MAISNTNILIKRSTTTSKPTSLQAGELAYSYLSNTIFIGSPSGTGVVNVGGQYYTSQVDNATSTNTVSTIVKRDASGNIAVGAATVLSVVFPDGTTEYTSSASAGTYANGAFVMANAAFAYANTISGGSAVDNLARITANAAFGQANGAFAQANASFAESNSAASYANSSFAVANSAAIYANGAFAQANGAFTTANNAFTSSNGAIAWSTANSAGSYANSGFAVANSAASYANSGFVVANSAAIYANGAFLQANAAYTRANNSLNANTGGTVQGTIFVSTGAGLSLNTTGSVVIGGDITLTGNLNISGNANTYSSNTLSVSDPMIYLAANNTADAVDIGFVGHFIGQGSSGFSHYQHTGFVRDYNDRKWKLFSNVTAEPSSTVDFGANTIYDTIKVGGIDLSYGSISSANVLSANTLTLVNALTVPYGGTGATTLGAGQILIGNGTGAISAIANVGTAGTYGSSSYIPVVTTDAYGRVTAVSNTQIAISASQVTSGTLAIAQGGTNQSSYTNNQITYYNGTSIVSLANTGTAGTYGAINYIPIITTDGFGRVSSVSNTAISGLTVSQGGTGQSSFTQYGITYGNGTSGLGVTAVAGTSDQTYSNEILTVTNAGVPVWTSALDGGQF